MRSSLVIMFVVILISTIAVWWLYSQLQHASTWTMAKAILFCIG